MRVHAQADYRPGQAACRQASTSEHCEIEQAKMLLTPATRPTPPTAHPLCAPAGGGHELGQEGFLHVEATLEQDRIVPKLHVHQGVSYMCTKVWVTCAVSPFQSKGKGKRGQCVQQAYLVRYLMCHDGHRGQNPRLQGQRKPAGEASRRQSRVPVGSRKRPWPRQGRV